MKYNSGSSCSSKCQNENRWKSQKPFSFLRLAKRFLYLQEVGIQRHGAQKVQETCFFSRTNEREKENLAESKLLCFTPLNEKKKVQI